jgi:glycosyltransferase involved in cell wall biosynthesis
MKVLYLGSVEAPYQKVFWDEVSKNLEVQCVYLYSSQAGHSWDSFSSDHVTHLDIQPGRLKAFACLSSILSKFKPNFIILGGYKIPFSVFLAIYAYFFDIKLFLWLERPLPSNSFSFFLKNLYLKIYCYLIDGILAIGNDAVSHYKNLTQNVYNFPYSVDRQNFLLKNNLKNDDQKLRFIYIGQFIHRKGVMEAIEGFMMNKNMNIALTLVGGGDLDLVIENLVMDDQRITKLPYAKYNEIPKILHDHDVLIFPSRHDGWALTLVESMCAGLFIMGTQFTSSFNEYITDKVNGLKIEVEASDINNKIQWCVKNSAHVIHQGALNQSAVANSLSNANNAAQELKKILHTHLTK